MLTGSRDVIQEAINKLRVEIEEDRVAGKPVDDKTNAMNTLVDIKGLRGTMRLITEDELLDWSETHFEVVKVMTFMEDKSKRLQNIRRDHGRCGLYEFAKDLTDQFFLQNRDRQWDGEFYDEINEFVSDRI